MDHIALEETWYGGFAANLTTGAAGDGATPLFDVRLGGAAASAAPVLSGTPTLLTHANYLDGSYEVAIAATAGNGFAAGNTYLVFATLTIDSVTPGACIGSFRIAPVPANLTQIGGDAQSATDLKDFADAGYDPGTNKVQGVVLTDTVTTYTGNTPQTGDAFSRIGAAGAGLTAVVAASVTGSVGSVTAGVTLAASAVQAIWDALTSALTAVGSIGKLLVDNVNATISSRLASGSYTAPLDAGATQTAAAAALTAYDPPTNTEMEARTLAAASYATAEALASQNNLSAAQVNAEADAALADVGVTTTVTGRIDAAVSSRLATAGYTAPPTANQNADAYLDRADAVEVGLTPRQQMRLAAAADAGVTEGAGEAEFTIRNAVADSKDRIVAQTDGVGNRTSVTTDVT